MDTTTLQKQYPSQNNIPTEFSLKPVNQDEYLVNGELRVWKGETQDILSPVYLQSDSGVVQSVIGHAPMLSEAAVNEVMDAAVKAYDNGKGTWPTMTVAERITCVENFLSGFVSKKNEIVTLLMWEIGKTLADSTKEFDRTAAYIRDTIDAVKDLDRASSRFTITEGVIGQIRRSPLGVTLCMGPFNYPLNETFTTLIPALIMGNTVICKPPKLGILLYRPLLSLFRDCFPAGVVNFVYGKGQVIIGPMIASGKIDVLAFIGTSKVADTIKKQHPKPHRLRCVLGLDAKNPAIILKDADLDLTVSECLLGSLSFNGQRCTAIKMIFVHTSIAQQFLEKFSAAVEKLTIGMPWSNSINITPLPEKGKSEYLGSLVQDALSKGAKVINPSGGVSFHSLYFPAILFPVNPEMKVYTEEQFGPVIPVIPFGDIADPIRYIEESNFGQQVSIFSQDPDAVATLVDPLVNQVSRVNINSQCQRGPDTFPFTGRKDSAEGTLSVSDALRVFSIRALVSAKENSINKKILTDIVREHKSNFISTDFIF